MATAKRPERAPDIILPQEDPACEVHVWVKEGVYDIGGEGNYQDAIESGGQRFTEVIKYLEYCSQREITPKRAKIVATYLFEAIILNNEMES